MAKKILCFLQTRKQHLQFSYLIVFSAVLLLAVIAYLNNSLGWFVTGKTVTADNISIKAQADAEYTIAGFNVYKYKLDNESYTYSFYEGDDATLNSYDAVFISRNEKNAVIMKIDVTGLQKGTRFRLQMTCTDDTVSPDYISDVIYFRAAALDLEGTSEEIYNAAVTELKSNTYSNIEFITEEDGTITSKQTNIQTQTLTMTDSGSIYVLIDYNPNVIKSTDIEFNGGTNAAVYLGDISSIEVMKEG